MISPRATAQPTDLIFEQNKISRESAKLAKVRQVIIFQFASFAPSRELMSLRGVHTPGDVCGGGQAVVLAYPIGNQHAIPALTPALSQWEREILAVAASPRAADGRAFLASL